MMGVITYWLLFFCSMSIRHIYISMHPINSCPFHSMTIRPPIPDIQFDHENSRSKVKVKGTVISIVSSWLISFLFHINWTTIPKTWQIECSIGKKQIWNFMKKFLKKVSDRIPQKFNEVEIVTREACLPSSVVTGRAVLTLSWGEVKFCSASLAWWPWPKVTKMGTKTFSHTHRLLTMCGLKRLASGIFLESWKVLAEWRWQQQWQKRTKKNKSPGYPGWLN